jgi:hypothetical protein
MHEGQLRALARTKDTDMKKLISNGRRLLGGALTVLAAFWLAAPAAAVSLAVAPASSTVQLGQSFSVDLIADGATEGIGAWDFELWLSQPGVISLDSVTFSDALGSIAGGEALSFTGDDFGVVSLLAPADLLALQSSQPLTLATLTFTASAVGTTTLTLTTPPFGAMLADANGLELVPLVLDGSVTVTAVPEPATLLMMMLGGAAMGAGMRPRRA